MERQAGLLALLAVVFSCGGLPAIESDICGNGIVEPEAGEDCDGSTKCVPAGQPFECQPSCETDPCASGWVCGPDSVCRQPSFELAEAGTLGNSRIEWVEARDLDGDGRSELVWIESGAGSGSGTLNVGHVSENGAFERDWQWGGVASAPEFGDLDADGLEDILVSTGEPGSLENVLHTLILQNKGDGSFRPAQAGFNREDRPGYLGMVGGGARGAGPLAVWGGALHHVATGADGALWPVYDPSTHSDSRWLEHVELVKSEPLEVGLAADGETPVDFSEIWGDGDIDEPPFADCAAAARSVALEGSFIDGGWNGGVRVHYGAEDCAQHNELSPPADATSLHGVHLADVDGDRRPDLIVTGLNASSQGTLWLAYGLGDRTFHSSRVPPPISDVGDMTFGPAVQWLLGADPTLLLATDIDGDTRADLISLNGSFIPSDSECSAEGCLCYEGWNCDSGASLPIGSQTEVVTAVNLNGIPGDEVVFMQLGSDEVTVARWDTDQFRAETFQLPGSDPDLPRSIAAADFDGDTLEDAAIQTRGLDGMTRIYLLRGGAPWKTPILVLDGVDLRPGLASDYPDTHSYAGAGWLSALSNEGGDASAILQFRYGNEGTLFSPLQIPGGMPWDHPLVGSFRDAGVLDIAAFPDRHEPVGTLEALQRDGWMTRVSFEDSGLVLASSQVGARWPHANHNDDERLLQMDVDQNGIDEILKFTPLQQNEFAPVSTSIVSLDVNTTGFEEVSRAQFDEVMLGGTWPRAAQVTNFDILDIDGDGSVELFALGHLEDRTSRLGVVMHPEVPDLAPEQFGYVGSSSSNWQAYEFMDEGPATRYVAVLDSQLESGSYDSTSDSSQSEFVLELPSDVNWSAHGHFNDDGIPDLLLATDAGAMVLLGVAHPPGYVE
jgi:hypothetical protein